MTTFNGEDPNCAATDGISHSPECRAEHNALGLAAERADRVDRTVLTDAAAKHATTDARGRTTYEFDLAGLEAFVATLAASTSAGHYTERHGVAKSATDAETMVAEWRGANTSAPSLADAFREYLYRTASLVPFEHAEWAQQHGAALLAALKSAAPQADAADAARALLARCLERIEGDWRAIDSEWGPVRGGLDAEIAYGLETLIPELRAALSAPTATPPTAAEGQKP